jgi:hypothetical protein
MTDPTFGEIKFNNVDAWDGIVPFEHGPSDTSEFAVHIWADEAGPSATQRSTFDQLKIQYPVLWPSIADALLECHAGLDSVEELSCSFSPTVGCYIEGGVDLDHANFELVYTFDLPGEGSRGFFARIVGWEVVEACVAE